MKQRFRRKIGLWLGLGGLLLQPQWADAKSVLSEMILFPGAQPVRLTLPAAAQEVTVTTMRPIPAGVNFASENGVFKILCPDLTVLIMSGGESPNCPPSETTFLAQVSSPPPLILDDIRGPATDAAELSDAELSADVQTAASRIEQLPLAPQEKWYALTNLYYAQHACPAVIRLLAPQFETLREPLTLQLLGVCYLQAGSTDWLAQAARTFARLLAIAQEADNLTGQAIAQHYLAVLLKKNAETVDARRYAQQALQCYEALGNAEMAGAMRHLLATWE